MPIRLLLSKLPLVHVHLIHNQILFINRFFYLIYYITILSNIGLVFWVLFEAVTSSFSLIFWIKKKKWKVNRREFLFYFNTALTALLGGDSRYRKAIMSLKLGGKYQPKLKAVFLLFYSIFLGRWSSQEMRRAHVPVFIVFQV